MINGRAIAASLCLMLFARASVAGDGQAPVIRAVLPGRIDSLLACVLSTGGLPGREAEEVLGSGIPSSLVLRLRLLGPEGRAACEVLEEIRIEPDLLEGGFLLRLAAGNRRVISTEALREDLQRLGPFALIDPARLGRSDPWRLRASLALHPLAPPEIERVRSLFTGEDEPEDRREVSIGLGGLLRRLLGGERKPISLEAQSAPFQLAELPLWDAGGREQDRSPPAPPAPERRRE